MRNEMGSFGILMIRIRNMQQEANGETHRTCIGRILAVSSTSNRLIWPSVYPIDRGQRNDHQKFERIISLRDWQHRYSNAVLRQV